MTSAPDPGVRGASAARYWTTSVADAPPSSATSTVMATVPSSANTAAGPPRLTAYWLAPVAVTTPTTDPLTPPTSQVIVAVKSSPASGSAPTRVSVNHITGR